jgi:GNAT superfamily N-acetyltransferase
MPLKLLPLTESDLYDWNVVANAAFEPDAHTPILFPRPSGDSGRGPSEADIRQQAKDSRPLLDDPDTYLVKVIDTDLQGPEGSEGKLIAAAHWQVFPRELTPEELDKKLEIHVLAGASPEPWLELQSHYMESRRQIMGTRPHVVLQMLVTDPEHHKRGAGGMLVKWGCEELADKKGLEILVGASTLGKILYERSGFVEVGKFDFEFRKWGGDDIVHTVWVRHCLFL